MLVLAWSLSSRMRCSVCATARRGVFPLGRDFVSRADLVLQTLQRKLIVVQLLNQPRLLHQIRRAGRRYGIEASHVFPGRELSAATS